MIKDLRKKSSDELKLLVVQLRSQLQENRFKSAHGELDKTHLFKEIRLLIARTLTILHERNETMQAKDWHRFSVMMIEQQNKQAELKEQKSALELFKEKTTSFLKRKKPAADVKKAESEIK